MADSLSEDLGDASLEANEPGNEQAAVPFSLREMSSYTFGLVLLLFVVFLWTASSFLGSSIFADGTYAKPFFLTYLNTSTFILAAAPNFLGAAWRNRKSKEWNGQLAWIRERYRRGGWRLIFTDEKDDEKDEVAEGENLLSHARVSSDPGDLDDDEEGLRMSNSAAFSSPKIRRRPTWQRQHLALLPTAKIALQFCPLWFSSNYLASACLQHTSVASATILTSTSSIWTLVLGALSGTERFTMPKFLSINMSLLFGLIGTINAFFLAPLLPLLSTFDIEPFQLPPTPRIWAIALINSTASLIGDISWAHALLLTSPLVVTVGLSLTIPVSLVGEMFLQGRFESAVYWLGSLFVVDEHGMRPSARHDREHEQEHAGRPLSSPA
ncbi:hypothetical protein DV737_g2077, partial [Chaetothyriales sp. CBS 132003]